MLIRLIRVINNVGLGITGSQFIELRAIAKQNVPEAPYCIANEYICGRIGRLLGLPVPPVGLMSAGGTIADVRFASLDFNFTGINLPPLTLAQCQNMAPRIKTGIILFDVFIANSDRHRGNLAQDAANPANLAVFDHSHALLGTVAGEGRQRLIDMEDSLGITGGGVTGGNIQCLLRNLPTANFLQEWVHRIRWIPNYFIEDICREVVGMGVTQDESDAVADFLIRRKDYMVALLNDNQAQFHGITQWQLLI